MILIAFVSDRMPELLPIMITSDTHPVAIRLAQAYRPHTSIPSREELLSNRYEISGHVSMKNLTEQMGLSYNEEVKKRR